jgi:hypothetical protein
MLRESAPASAELARIVENEAEYFTRYWESRSRVA